ncbi:uncharacterized protein LOC119368178 [Triticum dicoccoides]|uniref:uncharacterized protein LOC119368178 n=1 Tax=Triticum dicoccoides TaxID=85692 RepID=UPI00188F3B65|nr:uncharacterized protein LOC119368178 [Triticum dicoccoides]
MWMTRDDGVNGAGQRDSVVEVEGAEGCSPLGVAEAAAKMLGSRKWRKLKWPGGIVRCRVWRWWCGEEDREGVHLVGRRSCRWPARLELPYTVRDVFGHTNDLHVCGFKCTASVELCSSEQQPIGAVYSNSDPSSHSSGSANIFIKACRAWIEKAEI